MHDDMCVNLRAIQQFMYCPRRFALIELNEDWQDNAFVINGDLLHEHVHDGTHSFSDKKKVVRSSVTVFNDMEEYNLFGVTDCMEFIKSDDGVEISGLDGKYKVCIVEYKPKAPKGYEYNEPDAIQVFGQKLCVDFVFGCNSEAYLYYADIKKRVKLPFDTEFQKYDTLIKNILSEIRKTLKSKKIPNRIKGQKCSGCSFSDVCFPKVREYNVRSIIKALGEED